MSRLSRYIVSTGAFQRWRRFASGVYPPGFEGLSLYGVVKILFKEIRVNKLNIRGAAVTYNFLMAIPPILLFLASLVPYMPVAGLQDSILKVLRFITPNENSYDAASRIVTDFLHRERRDVLSFGFFATLFFSSNGMMGLMRSFDRQLPFYKKRGMIRRRWVAIKLTVMLLVVTILSMGTLILLQSASVAQLIPGIFRHLPAIRILSTIAIVLLIFGVIGMIYKYGPSHTVRSSFVSPGSVCATLLCVLLTTVFFFLVNHVLTYNQVYGSIGTVMAFMVWLFLNTQVVLLGFELNVSILLGKMAQTADEERVAADN